MKRTFYQLLTLLGVVALGYTSLNAQTYSNQGHRWGCVNYAAITIEDNGPGIALEVKQQLFSPIDSTKGDDHAGLGLSIVNKLVKDMNGSIVCRSNTQGSTGKTGTQFQILLPK